MLIAVPLTDENFTERMKEAKEKGADLVELRVDQFSRTEVDYVSDLLSLAKEEGLGTILTVRTEEEGGRKVPNRREIFERLAPKSDYTDVELFAREEIAFVRNAVAKGRGRLIVSYHNFELTPANWILREILREGRRFGGIPKVAVKANSYEDVSRLLCVGNQEKYEKILIAMGDIGRISRLAGFIFGSVITYASLGKSLAPGQLPLEEMVKLRELFYK